MLTVINRLLRRHSYPLNQILISEKNLKDNYQYLSSLNPKIQIAPVLKSNAYGHGIGQIGKIADKLGAPFICIDSLYEAYQLLKLKVKIPILIMGYIDPNSLKVKKLPFSYAVWDLKLIEAINKYQKGAKVHIFVDTGMHREGVVVEDLRRFVKAIKLFSNLEVVGLMSHLAEGHKANTELTKGQISQFKEAKKICKQEGLDIKYFHLSASAGLFSLKNEECNVARAGKAFYGLNPLETPKNNNLKPVLSMNTKIVQIKQIDQVQRVGYDGAFIAKKPTVVAVLPLGYNDGVDRRLSNKGFCKVAGKYCPIIGRVSMNLTTIDISEVKDAKVGDEVEVFSNNPKDKNSISSAAKLCGTIAYDLLVKLHPSTRRVVI